MHRSVQPGEARWSAKTRFVFGTAAPRSPAFKHSKALPFFFNACAAWNGLKPAAQFNYLRPIKSLAAPILDDRGTICPGAKADLRLLVGPRVSWLIASAP
jgi:hypothetical protein